MHVDQEVLDAFENHGIINTSLMMEASMFGHECERGSRWLGRDSRGNDRGSVAVHWSDNPLLERVFRALERLHPLVKRFDREVWLNGFGKEYMEKAERGYEAPFGEDTIMTYVMAGRVLLTFQMKNGSQFTLITDDCLKDPRMGIQSMACTEAEMDQLLTDAIDAFEAGGLGIQHNANVRILGT